MGNTPSDRALWLARFVMPAEPALRKWLARHRIDGLDVDDLIQETYAILAGLKSVDDIRDPRRYAFQTAYSLILAHLRRARIVSITTVADLDFMGFIADAPSPEREACDRDEFRNVAEAIGALPQRVREVFILRRVDGMPQRDVAELLGISENTVEKCVARGVQALMDAFKRGGKTAAETPDREKAADKPSEDGAVSVRGKTSI